MSAAAALLTVLDLRPQGVDAHGQDVFEGESQWQPHGRVFGGQVLGQTLVAAGRTVPAGRTVHSMHGYFIRPGDARDPIRFAVERLRDGRSFSTRRVHAIQHEQPILSMIASFQTAQDGMEHQDEMPDVPPPEDLPTTRDLLGHVDHPVAQYWANERPMDLRHVQQPIYWEADPHRVAHQALWMRTPAPMPDDEPAAPRGARLRERLHAARVGAAPARAHLGDAADEVREPGPRDVVAPPGAGRRVAAVRAGQPLGDRWARARCRAGLQPRRAARGLRRAGGDDPRAGRLAGVTFVSLHAGVTSGPPG
ncbi:hypothetical protein GCM10025868_10580 [Angustibacter aerolatus]|uniref:Acyl-CoA thioesterase-like N-terminal HotDog domain-containing protein n=1 Tax=Angustibacter aerolatus TaxID=1162965 RepID=A0ABQ6JCA0_9ACTN|nr:hypothetical protein GCM10025868_10580 [Angustibacter aerolatus]